MKPQRRFLKKEMRQKEHGLRLNGPELFYKEGNETWEKRITF